jgi:hypothetical protein
VSAHTVICSGSPPAPSWLHLDGRWAYGDHGGDPHRIAP